MAAIFLLVLLLLLLLCRTYNIHIYIFYLVCDYRIAFLSSFEFQYLSCPLDSFVLFCSADSTMHNALYSVNRCVLLLLYHRFDWGFCLFNFCYWTPSSLLFRLLFLFLTFIHFFPRALSWFYLIHNFNCHWMDSIREFFFNWIALDENRRL